MPLNKTDVIDQITNKLPFTKNEASDHLEYLIEIIKSTLESGENVKISNFGKFEVKEKKERTGRNPVTNSDMILRARRVVVFKCSANLKKRINRK
jgi:integration host factor subunit alpha